MQFVKEAMEGPYREYWLAAIDEEWASLGLNKTLKLLGSMPGLAELPYGNKAIPSSEPSSHSTFQNDLGN